MPCQKYLLVGWNEECYILNAYTVMKMPKNVQKHTRAASYVLESFKHKPDMLIVIHILACHSYIFS